MCVAADSNCLIEMQNERMRSEDGSDGPIATAILSGSYLALDIDDSCMAEACDCVRGVLEDELRQWVIRMQNDGKIRLLAMPREQALKRRLLQAGLPRKDAKWAILAAHPCVQYLLTEDIDFYDPAEKAASAARKERLKNNRTGAMLRLIRREAAAEVISLRHVPTYFP